jgi:hypothetical protein
MAEGGCDQKAGGDTAAIFIRYASQDVGIGNAVCAPSRMRTTLAGIVATFGHALQRKFRKGVAFLVALIIAAGAAVAAAASNEPIEYLDQETGATVTTVGRPLVFFRNRSDFPGKAQDYVTLAAAAVNQSGKMSYVLIGYFWWFGAPPKAELAPSAAETLALQADDRNIQLVLRAASAHELGIGVPVHRPPLGNATAYVYAIDLSTMGIIAESHQLAVHLQNDGTSLTYTLFEDRRPALREFVRRFNRAD